MKIFLAIVILLILVLLIPVKLRWNTSPEITVRISYLFFKKQLLPAGEKAEKSKEPQKEKEEKPEKEKKKKEPPLSKKDILSLLPKAWKRLLAPIKRLLRRTTIADLRLKMVVAGDESAETAIKFGKTNAAVVNAIAVIDRIFTLKLRQADIIPGFESCQSSFECSGEVRAVPLAVLIAAVSLLINALILLLPVIISNKKRRAKAAADDMRKEDDNGKEEPAERCA